MSFNTWYIRLTEYSVLGHRQTGSGSPVSLFKQNISQPCAGCRVLRATLRFLLYHWRIRLRIIRCLGFIMHSFNARTLSGAVLLDLRMQRGTVDTELC